VVEQAGPIVTMVARHVFGEASQLAEAGRRELVQPVAPDQPKPGEGEEAPPTAEALLHRALEALRDKHSQIQVQGQALTREERQRSEALSKAIRKVEGALKDLQAQALS
jgi:hypothetical protein